MNVSGMLRQLQDERNRIDQAISALRGLDSRASSSSLPRLGRPPMNSGRERQSGRRRRMSAAARKRISDAAKAHGIKQSETDRKKLRTPICTLGITGMSRVRL